jgi:hypothetical protein
MAVVEQRARGREQKTILVAAPIATFARMIAVEREAPPRILLRNVLHQPRGLNPQSAGQRDNIQKAHVSLAPLYSANVIPMEIR